MCDQGRAQARKRFGLSTSPAQQRRFWLVHVSRHGYRVRMTENRKIEGRCWLCGEYRLLTLEHIPPRSAFNDHEILLKSVDKLTEQVGHSHLAGRGCAWLDGPQPVRRMQQQSRVKIWRRL